MKNILKNEPVISAALISGLVAAVLRLIVSFGVEVTDDQVAAILDLVNVVAPLLVGPLAALVARRLVTANGNVVEREENGVVLAGEANELPTGAEVRPAGSLGTDLEEAEGASI